jgi:hypothetical protein
MSALTGGTRSAQLESAASATGIDEEHRRARFASAVVLGKHEAFGLCETLAVAERALLRAGCGPEAARAALAFELIEGRMTL